MSAENNSEERRNTSRKQMDAPVQFIVDADILDARSQDISDTGIRMMTNAPIRIIMRLTKSGETEDRIANLVWARKSKDGGLEYGFEFLPEEPE